MCRGREDLQMAGRATRFYWMLPYPVKEAATYLFSLRTERERYGPDFRTIIDEIASHDRWSLDQFREYQRQKLHELIVHAVCHVPYYRELFEKNDIDPHSIRRPEDLERIPILEKETVRTQGTNLVDERLDPDALIVEHTSGTTGTPISLYRDTYTSSTATAFIEARFHAVAGMRRGRDKSISIGGKLVTAPDRERPPFWIHNRRWNQLYLSSYHLAPKNLPHYVRAMREFGAVYIEGYPSSIYAIARHIIDSGMGPVPFEVCFTTAETLFDHQREAISEAFGCRTLDQYGCGEMAVFAAECEEGSMHLSPEISIIEVLDAEDRPVGPGETGALVCTGLANRIQPFIRYRLGDLGSLSDAMCPCGRRLPLLGHVEGRADNVIMTRDGRRIGRLDPVFKGLTGIREAQIVQDEYNRLRIRIVPGMDYSGKQGTEAAARLADRVGGGCAIKIEIVERIERTGAGKFEAVVSNIGKQQGDAAV